MLVFVILGLILLIMGIVIRYKQISEQIKELKPDQQAEENVIPPQALVLRSSQGLPCRSAGHSVEELEEQYRSAG